MPEQPVTPGPGMATWTGYPPTPWMAGDFARDWLADAKKEACGTDRHAKRREILFSVCFLESYLLEWVRDQILKKDYGRLATYFPPNSKRPILKRWEFVTTKLLQDHLISSTPDFDRKTSGAWRDLIQLINLRNWLCHAGASRPISEAFDQDWMRKFADTPNGWALDVSIRVVRELHQAAGDKFPVPEWIDE